MKWILMQLPPQTVNLMRQKATIHQLITMLATSKKSFIQVITNC